MLRELALHPPTPPVETPFGCEACVLDAGDARGAAFSVHDPSYAMPATHLRRCYGWHGRGERPEKPTKPAPDADAEEKPCALDARAIFRARRNPPIRHWLSHASWRHVEKRRRRRSPVKVEEPAKKAPAKRRRRRSTKPIIDVEAPPRDADRCWPDEASPRWARRRGAAKTEGLNSRHWRREKGIQTKARRAAEAAMRRDAPRKAPVAIDAVRGHFLMRWYLDRIRNYVARRKWRRLKKEEREVLKERAAEASRFDEDAKRRARAARAQRRWRELSWRHVNRVEGLGGSPVESRRRRAAERKFEGRRWTRLELGWDATLG